MRLKILFTFLVFLLVFSSCSDEEPIIDDNQMDDIPNEIMPLGASRVQGARPLFESFRYDLWKLLVDGGFEFDFIGTVDDRTSYAEHMGMQFDPDHEGRAGWTSGQILNGLPGWLDEAGAPDFVLFSSPGGNDALQGMPYNQIINNINSIIDIIQDTNPNVTIVVEKLAPARSDIMTTELESYFNQMKQDIEEIAQQQTTATSSVIVVDMATGFSDEFYADPVHYNAEGALFVANKYYEVLEGFLER